MIRDAFIAFAKWRDKRLRFRADWWRDWAKWWASGGRFADVRKERQDLLGRKSR